MGTLQALITFCLRCQLVVVYDGFQVFVKVWKRDKSIFLCGSTNLKSPLIFDKEKPALFGFVNFGGEVKGAFSLMFYPRKLGKWCCCCGLL